MARLHSAGDRDRPYRADAPINPLIALIAAASELTMLIIIIQSIYRLSAERFIVVADIYSRVL